MTEDYRIYVASLTDYNAGRLHGEWIYLEGKDSDDVHAEIAAMLERSPEAKAFPQGGPAEEWAIHDYDGIPSSFGEHASIETLCQYVEWLSDSFGEDYANAKRVYFETVHNDLEVAMSQFEGAYRGTWDSPIDYAAELLDETIACHSFGDEAKALVRTIGPYIDYESFARDLNYGGTYFVSPDGKHSGHDIGTCHVFEAV